MSIINENLKRLLCLFSCLFLGAALATDSIVLMLCGVFGFGVYLPLGVSVFLLAIGLKWQPIHYWLNQKKWRLQVWRLGWTGAGIWLASVAVFFYFIQVNHDTEINRIQGPVKTIIVLGSNASNCKPNATLRARVDLGLVWAERLPDAKVVVSGGLDRGEECTEAEAMGNYLRARGLAPARILQEERSTSTFENFAMSKKLMADNKITSSEGLLIVTSDFHSVRSHYIARKAGFNNTASAGAETPLSVRYNNWLREYFAFISGYILGEYAGR